MMEHLSDIALYWDDWLPIVFLGLMGLSALVYVVLDGFDLGIGILSPLVDGDDKNLMIASIGPFWDANETWLVLAVGLLLVAFPSAHGAVLGALYIPTTAMLVGLILRGVAFEFRVKGPQKQRRYWNAAFFIGSLIATVSQGYMLGYYILGLPTGWVAFGFASLVAAGVTSAYLLIGSCWLLAKTEGALQQRAIGWAKMAVWGTAAAMAWISAATPFVSERIFNAWFAWPNVLLLAPVPIAAVALILGLSKLLNNTDSEGSKTSWIETRRVWWPFVMTSCLFVLAFLGLAYSFFPYVVPESLTVWEAAAARDSLFIILIGTCVTLPMIVAYSVFAYWVFRGGFIQFAHHAAF